jgi:hypothetical protein
MFDVHVCLNLTVDAWKQRKTNYRLLTTIHVTGTE